MQLKTKETVDKFIRNRIISTITSDYSCQSMVYEGGMLVRLCIGYF